MGVGGVHEGVFADEKGLALRVVGMYNVYQVWNEVRVGHKKGRLVYLIQDRH